MNDDPPPLGRYPASRTNNANLLSSLRWPLFLIVLSTLAFFAFQAFAVLNAAIKEARESAAFQTTRAITLAMFQYANDHNGNYPTGHSSTEVFQQLLDGNYLVDPDIFYLAGMSGKTKPSSKQLKPENVSYDVTVPVDSHSPEGLPIVFLTGYRIEYQPNGSAISLLSAIHPFAGLAACYHSNNARVISPDSISARPNIEHVLPSSFDPKGQHFQQLTPDGPITR